MHEINFRKIKEQKVSVLDAFLHEWVTLFFQYPRVCSYDKWETLNTRN